MSKRVLCREKLAPEGIALLESQGFTVDDGTAWSDAEFMERISAYHGLIIRSATKVTAEVLRAGTRLQVVGRAGVGVDNVDLEEATRRGVIVVNAPQSNVLSAAEHTIALIMACARNIPQAHAALKEGRWEKGRWGKGGVELRGKVLGVIGLGRIGLLVAENARGLGMEVLAYDPFVSADRFNELGVKRAEDADELYRHADFLTVHLPKNAETVGFIDDEAFAKMKDGVRVVNVARGGIIDEAAWARALASGKVAASAVDVYPQEPTVDDPLFAFDSVVCTPHLGASTAEAQLRASTIIAEQVATVLRGELAVNAVNAPLAPSEDAGELMPLFETCVQLGRVVVQLADGPVENIEVEYAGAVARYDTRLLTLGVLQGVLGSTVDTPLNYINAERIAAERGVTTREVHRLSATDFLNLVTVTVHDGEAAFSVAGTTLGARSRPRLVAAFGRSIDIELEPHMILVRAKQAPGILGRIGTKLGEFGRTIGQVSATRPLLGELDLLIFSFDEALTGAQLEELSVECGLTKSWSIEL